MIAIRRHVGSPGDFLDLGSHYIAASGCCLGRGTQIFMGSAARFLAPVLSESFFSESSSESSWTKASVRRCACSEVGRVLSAKPSIVLAANTDALFAYVRPDT